MQTFIPDTVMLETEWVLRHAYGFSSVAIYNAFTKLCGLPNVALPIPYRMMMALQWYSDGMDFRRCAPPLPPASDAAHFIPLIKSCTSCRKIQVPKIYSWSLSPQYLCCFFGKISQYHIRPALFIESRVSIITRSPSIQPSFAPAFIIEYSPLTL